MIRKFLFSAVLLTFVVSCKKETVFKEVKINDRYSISVPDYLQPCTDLHKDASLQYQNTEIDIYAMVIDERKKTMENYSLDYDIDLYYNNIASQPFLETIKDVNISPAGRQKIDGHKALISEITGKIDQNSIYYRLGVIETPYAFYQLLIWTRGDNREKYEPDMKKMIESFKELPQPDSELPTPTINPDSVKIELKY